MYDEKVIFRNQNSFKTSLFDTTLSSTLTLLFTEGPLSPVQRVVEWGIALQTQSGSPVPVYMWAGSDTDEHIALGTADLYVDGAKVSVIMRFSQLDSLNRVKSQSIDSDEFYLNPVCDFSTKVDFDGEYFLRSYLDRIHEFILTTNPL